MNIFFPVAGLIRCLILMAAITLCYPGDVWAEPTEVQELKLKVETLKKRVQELELTAAPKLNIKKRTGNKSWQSLVVGLSKAEVISLLGKPGKIDKWKTGEAWYYPNPRGGEIDFDVNGQVSGWLEP